MPRTVFFEKNFLKEIDMRYILGFFICVVAGLVCFFFFGHGATVEKFTTINKEKVAVSPLAKRMWEARNQYDANKASGCAKKFGGIDALIRKAETQDDIGFEAEQCLEQIIQGKAKTEYRPKFSQATPQPSPQQVVQRPLKALQFQYRPPSSSWASVARSTFIDSGTCAMQCESDTVIRIKNAEYIGSTKPFPCDVLHVGGLIAVRSAYPQQSHSAKGECSIEQLSKK